jgi:hypothetical protein
MPRGLVTELVIGGVAAAAGDQSQVLPAASELMLGQTLIPTNSRTAYRSPEPGYRSIAVLSNPAAAAAR